MTVKEAIKLLESSGFTRISQRGSHIKYGKGSFRVNIVMHRSPKETLSTGIIKCIKKVIEDAKIS